MGDHTTADDARRYREASEVEEWADKCPLKRLRGWLEGEGAWDAKKEEALIAEAEEVVNAAVKRAFDIAKPSTEDIFDHTFADIPADLKLQRDTMRTNSLSQMPQQETLRTGAGHPQTA
jgi:pyruvate dehydrogenase E1 component alpha subunit